MEAERLVGEAITIDWLEATKTRRAGEKGKTSRTFQKLQGKSSPPQGSLSCLTRTEGTKELLATFYYPQPLFQKSNCFQFIFVFSYLIMGSDQTGSDLWILFIRRCGFKSWDYLSPG